MPQSLKETESRCSRASMLQSLRSSPAVPGQEKKVNPPTARSSMPYLGRKFKRRWSDCKGEASRTLSVQGAGTTATQYLRPSGSSLRAARNWSKPEENSLVERWVAISPVQCNIGLNWRSRAFTVVSDRRAHRRGRSPFCTRGETHGRPRIQKTSEERQNGTKTPERPTDAKSRKR